MKNLKVLQISAATLTALVLVSSPIFGQSASSGRGLRPPFTIAHLRARSYSAGAIGNVRPLSLPQGLEGRIISYTSDGLALRALIEAPAGTRASGKKLPVLMLAHGYIDPKVYKTGVHYRRVSDRFARAGYLVIMPDFRGHDRSEAGSPVYGMQYFYAIDLLNLLAGVSQIPEADTSHMELWGHSNGGLVSLYVLEVTQRFQKASLWAPTSNPFPSMIYFISKKGGQEAGQRYIAHIESVVPKSQWPQIDAVQHLSYIKTPLLLQHGTGDESVPYNWSLRLIEGFKKAGISYKFYSYPNDNHNLTHNNSAAFAHDISFFNIH